jgi:Na+/melibiose symporter-like transporter
MVYIVAGFVGAPLTAAWPNRISKHRALMLTTTLYSVGLGLLLFLPEGKLRLVVPAMAIEGALAAGFGVMIRAITADIGDELRLEGGREQIGLLYSLTAATSKLAGAFSIALTFNLLALFGYDPRGSRRRAGAAPGTGPGVYHRADRFRHARGGLLHRLQARRQDPRRNPETAAMNATGSRSTVDEAAPSWRA